MTEPVRAPRGEADDLPVPVRTALLAIAAEVLGTLEPADTPAALRQVQRFAPRRRASAGALPLGVSLARDDVFRGRVARVWSHARPDLAERLGRLPDEIDGPVERLDDLVTEAPVESAVGAWLVRPDGWLALIESVARHLESTDVDGDPLAVVTERALRAETEAAQLTARLGVALDGEAAARDEVAVLTREQRRLRSDADRARSQSRRELAEASGERAQAERLRAVASAELDRARELLRAAAAERTAARGEIRFARELASTRARLLLDTIVEAGSALRDELALPPASAHPADLVAPAAGATTERPSSRGRTAHDPALVDELLALPYAHLIVDGYNVSKSGYPQLALGEQRRRLVESLANGVGHTGAEITCCFDGQEGPRPPGGYARGVRVLFSIGEIADDLIRRLVLAEPPGRVVIVVTSDQAVVRDVQAAGAWAVPSQTLLARLARV